MVMALNCPMWGMREYTVLHCTFALMLLAYHLDWIWIGFNANNAVIHCDSLAIFVKLCPPTDE